jgi:hypothetical protein
MTTTELLAASAPHASRVEIAGLCWALRVDSAEMEPGDLLPPSRVWVDGDPTDDLLPGTSALRIGFALSDDLVGRTLRAAGGYLGARVALVAGRILDDGEDAGEVVLDSPEVIAVWER